MQASQHVLRSSCLIWGYYVYEYVKDFIGEVFFHRVLLLSGEDELMEKSYLCPELVTARSLDKGKDLC